MNNPRCGVSRFILACLLAILPLSCQTTRRAPDEARIRPRDLVPFVPRVGKAQIVCLEGRYPNLYEAGSYAIWQPASPSVTESRADTIPEGGNTNETSPTTSATLPTLTADPSGMYVVECELISSFPDMSIAYDAVGLRGVHVYLQTPTGQQLPVQQQVMDRNLSEEQVGALKRFRRKNTLYFAREPLLAPAGTDAALLLVLEGFESRFAFEWKGVYVAPNAPPAPKDSQAVKQLKQTVQKTHKKTKDLLHRFD
jgi:hypothetical protein